MKILLILVLAALLVGCVSTVPDETIPDKPDAPPSSSITAPPLSYETEESGQTDSETTADETEPTAAPTETTQEDNAPEAVRSPHYAGDIFYFSQKPPAPNGEPVETYTALAALTFDFSAHPKWWISNYNSTVISHTDETVTINSTEYLRMVSDRVVYSVDSSFFQTPKGFTADEKPYLWVTRTYRHPTASVEGTEYLTWIQLDDDSMVQLSFFGYAYDEDFENTILRPLLDSCRIWTDDIPFLLRFPSTESDPNIAVDLTLPVEWQWNNSTVADDMERMYTGRYSVKRMEFYPVLRSEVFEGYERLQYQGVPAPITGKTNDGLPYEIYAYDSVSEGDRSKVTWYFANIEHEDGYLMLSFLTFEDDPADYFETVTLPVIKSVHIEETE